MLGRALLAALQRGEYSADEGYFADSEIVAGPLHALRDGLAGGNGVFAYGTNLAFPVNRSNATNYWVDVVFSVHPVVSSV